MSKRLTVTDLLKQKEKFQVKSGGTAVVEIDRLGVEVVINKPEKSLCLEALSMARDEKTSDSADSFLVYSVIQEPNLKDPELQKLYDCVEPTEIVEKIFEVGEIAELANYALEFGGFKRGTISVVEQVKN